MIFVPKKNIYFPQPKWGFPKFQRGSVSVTPFANAAGQGAGGDTAALDTTVTVANEDYEFGGTSSTAIIYGYNRVANADYVAEPAFGSAGAFNYTDGGSNSRDVTAIYYGSGNNGSLFDDLVFSISTTSVPDTDTTFTKFDYNGTEYTRASRTTYTASLNGSSHWRYNNISPNGPLSGTVTFKVFV